MKKVSSILLAFIMLLSVGAGIPVSTAAASLPKSAVTSIVVFPCGFTANFSKQKNITGYQMQYSTSNKFNTKDTKAVRTTNTYSAIRKLGSSKRYYVRVRTYKKSGKKYTYSAWSSSKPVTTLNKNCPDPAHIKSLKGGNKKFTATTYKSANASGYQIRYSTKSNLSNAKIVTVNGRNNTTLNATGCAAGTKYYVQSRTFRKVNGKTYYSYWSPTTKNVTTNKAPTTTTKKPTTTTSKPVWCWEGGSKHVTPDGIGWYSSYNEAKKAGLAYIGNSGSSGSWEVQECDCGKFTVYVTIDELPTTHTHTWNTGVVTKQPTCTLTGVISSMNFTSKEQLLAYVKTDIDWDYQDLIDSGWNSFDMYVKLEARSDGNFNIYVMYG